MGSWPSESSGSVSSSCDGWLCSTIGIGIVPISENQIGHLTIIWLMFGYLPIILWWVPFPKYWHRDRSHLWKSNWSSYNYMTNVWLSSNNPVMGSIPEILASGSFPSLKIKLVILQWFCGGFHSWTIGIRIIPISENHTFSGAINRYTKITRTSGAITFSANIHYHVLLEMLAELLIPAKRIFDYPMICM